MKLLIRDRENIELGKEIGEKIGKEIGEKRGKEIGELSAGIRLIKNNHDQFSTDQLASLLGFDQSTIQEILESMEAHPDWNTEKIATELLQGQNNRSDNAK